MNAPVLARNDDAGDRFYTWGDESFWSVTTVINGGVPKYLVPWASKVTAELAYRELLAYGPHSRPGAIARRLAKAGRAYVLEQQSKGLLKSVKLDKLTSPELALRFLKGEPDRIRDAAGVIGSDVHSEAEKLVLEHARESVRLTIEGKAIRPWPAELAEHQASFVRFLEDHRPEFLATECTVFNRTQAFAGTADAILRVEVEPGVWVVAIADWKSGNHLYPEVGMQLAAYARGEFIGSPDRVTELPLPEIECGFALHIRPATSRNPKGYSFRRVRIDDTVWRSFLHAREVFRFQKEIARTVLGDELEPIKAVAA